MKKKISICTILDYILCASLLMLAIKKGGFYKFDTILFNLIVNISSIIYIVIKKDKSKINSNLSTLILLLAISYTLPVIFKNYSSLNDSIFEMIRYYNVYLIYCIVSKSSNKAVYKNTIIVVTTMLVILGIDQIAKGYMSESLKLFGSGYLTTNNIDRMSSTIQYANVFAIICFVGYILILDNLYMKKWNYYINNVIQMILLSGIILSGSRTILFLVLILIIYITIKCYIIKENIIHNRKFVKNIFINIIITFIYVVVLSKFITNNLIAIYIFTFIFYVLNILLFYVCKKYFNNFNFNEIKKSWQKFFLLILIVIIFLILINNIKTNIKLDSDSNKSFITRNIYDVDKVNNNILEIKVNELEEDTRYEIEVFQVDCNNKFKLVKKMYYYSTISGNFYVDIVPIENLKYINININCTNGSIKVDNILLNGKQFGKDYLLLPSSTVYRVIDALYMPNSVNYRIFYIKDSLKISFSSIKNLLFGIGGEGFRNEYKYFKSTDYNSTEVHNIYLQILLESGIFGLIIFIFIIIYTLRKYKLSSEKIALISVLVHGIFDLDFSYMIVLAIFGILLGLMQSKENDFKTNLKSKIIDYTKYILSVLIWIITTVILIKSNIGSKIKLYSVSNIEDVYNIEEKLENYEKIVMVDNFEPTYRIKLIDAYNMYLINLEKYGEDNIDKNKYNNVIKKLSKNLNYLYQNESMNTSYLLDISIQYLKNLNYLIQLNYDNNLDEGYEYYLNIIYKNFEKMYNCNDEKLRFKIKDVYNSYIKQLENLDNNIVNKYVKLLESVVCL